MITHGNYNFLVISSSTHKKRHFMRHVEGYTHIRRTLTPLVRFCLGYGRPSHLAARLVILVLSHFCLFPLLLSLQLLLRRPEDTPSTPIRLFSFLLYSSSYSYHSFPTPISDTGLPFFFLSYLPPSFSNPARPLPFCVFPLPSCHSASPSPSPNTPSSTFLSLPRTPHPEMLTKQNEKKKIGKSKSINKKQAEPETTNANRHPQPYPVRSHRTPLTCKNPAFRPEFAPCHDRPPAPVCKSVVMEDRCSSSPDE